MRAAPGVLLVVSACLGFVGCTTAGSSTESARTQEVRLIGAGSEALAHHDPASAVHDYGSVLRIDAKNTAAAYDLGVAYEAAGDTTAALHSYDMALTSDPTFVPALFNKAGLLTATQPSEAISIYRQILTHDPLAASSYFNLGLLLVERWDPGEGTADVGEAIHLEPSLATRVPWGLTVPKVESGSPGADPAATTASTASRTTGPHST